VPLVIAKFKWAVLLLELVSRNNNELLYFLADLKDQCQVISFDIKMECGKNHIEPG
jgi:hypothetical protein